MVKLVLDDLAKRVAAGDGKAYTLLLHEAARFLRGYVYARVAASDRAAVEDIVQDTLLTVHTKYQSYDPTMPFMPWLRTVAHHKLVDHWRRQKIAFLVSTDEEGAAEIADSVDVPAQTNAALSLERMFANLSDKQRRVVQLARLDGKSMTEIATELSITVSDAKVTLHRAILKLSAIAREDMGGEGHAHG